MKEIITKHYTKIADLKTFPSVPQTMPICKEKGDRNSVNIKKKKKIPQVNMLVDDISINDIRE